MSVCVCVRERENDKCIYLQGKKNLPPDKTVCWVHDPNTAQVGSYKKNDVVGNSFEMVR